MSKTSQRTIEAQRRRARAVALRRMGWSYERIAKDLGISKSSAHKTVTKAMAEVQAELDGDAEVAKAMELERLNELQTFLWDLASVGDYMAVDRILKIMERRAKLMGLDAPSKVAPTNPDGDEPYDRPLTDDELDARIAELSGKVLG